MQEIAYESLLKARRQSVHRCVAETVRDQHPDRANTEPEIVAHHFTQAGLPALAVEWWGKAAELAMRRCAYAEAIAHLETALKLVERIGLTGLINGGRFFACNSPMATLFEWREA